MEVRNASKLTQNYELNIMYCVPVTDITLNTDEVQLMVGGKYSLKATIYPVNAYDKSVTWESDNTNVVTVSADGVLTAIGPGSTNVIVKSSDSGEAYVCTVTVDDYDKEVDLADGVYRIQNLNSKLYVDGSTTVDNVRNFKQKTYSDDNSQLWVIKSDGEGYQTIEAAYRPGLYLTAVGTNNTNCVLDYDRALYGWNNDAQKWKIVKNPNNTYRIISKAYKGYAIAVFAASTLPEENMVMFEDNQTLNAIWTFTPAERIVLPDGVYTFNNVNSGHALDILEQDIITGTGLMQNVISESDRQRWIISYVSDGFYTISSSADPEKCLQATSPSTVAMGMYSNDPNDMILWAIIENEDGSYRISPKINPDKSMVVVGALDISGAEVILFDDNMTTNGWWDLDCEHIYSGNIEEGSYRIANDYTNMYMGYDEIGGVEMLQVDELSEQYWEITAYNDEYFYITTLTGTGEYMKHIAVSESIENIGEHIVILKRNVTEDTIDNKVLWYLDDDGRIHSALYPNMVIAVENDSMQAGAGIVLIDANTANSEHWTLVKLQTEA